MDNKKDPYLSELDAVDLTEEMEEATKVDLQAPPPPPETDLGPDAFAFSSDIPVQLVMVIGRKTVTVKDLLSLHKGQVIELDRSPEEPVELVAGGKVIGRAELVEVEGRLGVRVLQLLK